MASKPEQEPSIEEILASIRQIISDDDQPRDAAVDLTQAPEEKFEIPVAQAEPEKPKASFAEVLELTNEIPDEPEVASNSDIDAMFDETPSFSASVAEPEPEIDYVPPPVETIVEKVTPFPTQAPSSADAMESIFTNTAAEATSAAFSKLVGNIPVEREENMGMYANGRVTLEDMVRDMLKPMLRDWVNTHVPGIVERLVEKELEKLARQARDD